MYDKERYRGKGEPYKPHDNNDYSRKRSWKDKRDGGYQRSNERREENKPKRKCFTLVLDSETPQYVIDDLVDSNILTDLENMGLYMRIGVPEKGGLDTKAIRDKYRNHLLMLPWKNFNQEKSPYCVTTDEAKGIYKSSTMAELSDAVLAIAGLKVNLLLGESCENPSLFLLTWTIDGAETIRDLSKDTGYLSVLIKLANKNNIKVLNLNNATAWDEVIDVAEKAMNH